MACVHNDATVYDPGCHTKLTGRGRAALNDEQLCWVGQCRVKDLARKLHLVSVVGIIYSLLLARDKILHTGTLSLYLVCFLQVGQQ